MKRTSARAPASAPSALGALRGVGPALAARLARLGVRELADLLFLLPLRYEDRTHLVPLGALRAGSHAVVEGEVLLAEVVIRRRRQLLVRLGDGSGSLTLRFFHFSNTQRAGLARGTRLRCFGEVRRGPLGLEIVHPEYRHLGVDLGQYPLLSGRHLERQRRQQARLELLRIRKRQRPRLLGGVSQCHQ